MSDRGDIEAQAANRSHNQFRGGPYSANHPVPTVQKYREHRAELQERDQQEASEGIREQQQQDAGSHEPPKTKQAYESVKAIAKGETGGQKNEGGPYPTANRNWADRHQSTPRSRPDDSGGQTQDDEQRQPDGHTPNTQGRKGEDPRSATEQAAGALTTKDKRKAMKKVERGGAGREVTDPVTHLQVTTHDMTDRDLDMAPENEPAAGTTTRNSGGRIKSMTQLERDQEELDRGHRGMRRMFPPPSGEAMRRELMGVYGMAITVGLGAVGCIAVAATGALSLMQGSSPRSLWAWLYTAGILSTTAAAVFLLVTQVAGWLETRVEQVFDDEIWDAARREDQKVNESEVELPESVAWMNSVFSSVWPLINPDLFTSLADTLEDVMQASLPKVIRMVGVDDLGQGSEAIRILGVRWLPSGAAAQAVGSKDQLSKSKIDGQATGHTGQAEEEERAMDAGMEAEEGDFVNMELAFSYRAKTSGKSIKSKARNAHLYLKFYLPGGIAVPVWVELRGIVGIMRLRLQLTPDPPFFSLCTLTFLGQPRANLSCVPLSKHSLNIMDVPLISNFVQSSIDAALAMYVAPKSLSLNLKEMLMGDDSRKDTVSRGVILVHVKSARGFKQGDGDFGPMKGSSDTYVTVGWGKFGKPVAATRIIVGSREPNWNEWAAILVTPEELNAEETLRLQIWDSDKYTADDDLGNVDLTLKELTHSSQTKNRICDREDVLRGEDPDEKMPGKLTWSVGYFAKTRIQQAQFDKQTIDPNIRSVDDLKKWASETAASKLRESASGRADSDELHQQTVEDFGEREDEMIISTPPPKDYPSGILSIQIHNITGLEISKLNKRSKGDEEDGGEDAEQGDSNLPDSYCTVILNHQKVYRTRTKPKNAKPFFNAGTEKFVRDWRTAELIVSVRDSREHENDPLLGVLYLPLCRVFESQSQVMENFPLAGGIGYGRARISMVWRSVECKLPKELMGWDYGTLEVKSPIKLMGCTDERIGKCKIHLKTKTSKAKMKSPAGDGVWVPKGGKHPESVSLAVVKRYRTPLVIEFRQSSITKDNTLALAVLWLSEIPDEEEKQVVLKVWKGGKAQVERAHNCADYEGLEEGEEPLGEVQLTLKFWRGLSGFHKSYANRPRNRNVAEVMEVLDTVNGENLTNDGDEGPFGSSSSDSDSDSDSDSESPSASAQRDTPSDAEKRKMLRKAGTDSSSSSSSDNDEDSGDDPISKAKKIPSRIKERVLDGDKNAEDDGSRDAMGQIRDYRANRKQLHRKHRGIMQWKATRTLDWMAGKASLGKGKVGEAFKHSEEDVGIETEA
ncbi:uncharacterized protein DNG_02283 [Cephalotrichum gorgonifer]|uniref:Meiotically up-regulated gene 190 protein n=1 Tax=Cephalotrichum gorgonifer TaxID=2041049 RepID=A0AAE8MTA6_9PEZI|nr:uncharacterized protein DNG_02283 [Cephalotrichum gorgonifer]